MYGVGACLYSVCDPDRGGHSPKYVVGGWLFCSHSLPKVPKAESTIVPHKWSAGDVMPPKRSLPQGTHSGGPRRMRPV
jgi:hypothetical protein